MDAVPSLSSLIPAVVIGTAVMLVKSITDVVKAYFRLSGPVVLGVAVVLGQALVPLGLVAMAVPFTPQIVAQSIIAGIGVTLAAVGVTEIQKLAARRDQEGSN
mgnify:CR=1 FL=1